MTDVLVLSVRDNPDIIKLLNMFNTPGYESERQEFSSMLDYFEALTNQYNALMAQMTALDEKVSGITDKKNPLAIMTERIGSIVSSIGDKLAAIKDSIVDFAKDTLETAKDKSLSALGAAAGFLHISDGLQAVSEGLNKAAEKVENLELFHVECMESNLLTELKIPSNLESLTHDELKAVYAKLLDTGMNGDLSSAENAFLQDITEEIEGMLPTQAEQNTEPVLEAEQGEEI
jgi:hypothetical protein